MFFQWSPSQYKGNLSCGDKLQNSWHLTVMLASISFSSTSFFFLVKLSPGELSSTAVRPIVVCNFMSDPISEVELVSKGLDSLPRGAWVGHPLDQQMTSWCAASLEKKNGPPGGRIWRDHPQSPQLLSVAFVGQGSTSNSGGGSTEKNAPWPVLSTARISLAVEI